MHRRFASRLGHALGRLAVLCLACAAQALWSNEYSEQRDDVLGTTFSVTLVGLADARAQQVSAAILAEIARLENVFSTYRDDSELSRLNRNKGAGQLSPELASVLSLCEEWREKTANGFSCRLGGITALWRKSAEAGDEVPDRTALRKVARQVAAAPWELSAGGMTLHDMELDPSGLAKGFIIDQALARARALAPEATGIKIDIGGDGVYWGANDSGQPWRVAIAEPRHSADNDRYRDGRGDILALDSRAVAFSGHSRRHWQIASHRFSHILNPEDGWPVTASVSAVVVAKDVVTADALATALTVMPIAAGVELVDRLPDVEAMIMTESGKTFASGGWYSLLIPDDRHPPLWDDTMHFLVEYQVPAHNVAEYRRPYAALWITDGDKHLVRQLVVHGDSLRWLREVPLWWRRHGRHDESAIDGLARPTPAPGQHMVVWDGRDDRGRKVPEGNYVLHLEAAREHGGRELVTVPFMLNGEAFERQVQGEKELGRVRVSFSPSS